MFTLERCLMSDTCRLQQGGGRLGLPLLLASHVGEDVQGVSSILLIDEFSFIFRAVLALMTFPSGFNLSLGFCL